ncbi:MAG: sialidase family protein [Candidatus Dormibacteria bacterium]
MQVQMLAVSPAYARTHLVLVGGDTFQCNPKPCTQLWATRDGGGSWSELAAANWTAAQLSIAVDGSGRELFFGSGDRGLQVSRDGGASFQDIGIAKGLATATPDYAHDSTVALAASSRDYTWVDGPRQQHQVPGSNGAMVDLAFAFDPAYTTSESGYPVFLGGLVPQGQGNYQAEVARCDSGFRCAAPLALTGGYGATQPVVSPHFSDDQTVLAFSQDQLYRSTDGGASFAPVVIVAPQANTTTAVRDAAFDWNYSGAGADRTIYAAIGQVVQDPSGGKPTVHGGVFRSEDGGSTWSQVGPGSEMDTDARAVRSTSDGRLFGVYLDDFGSRGGPLCSADGQTWQRSCPPESGPASPVALNSPGTPGHSPGIATGSPSAGAAVSPSPGVSGHPTSSPPVGGAGNNPLAAVGAIGTRAGWAGWLALVLILVGVAAAGFWVRRRAAGR